MLTIFSQGVLTSWALRNLIKVALIRVLGRLLLALLEALPAGLKRAVLDQLGYELLADLLSRLVGQDRPLSGLALASEHGHVGIVTVLHALVQF